MLKIKNKFFLILFFNLCLICYSNASSRIAFTRPNKMMRVPSVDYSLSRKLLNINIIHESLSKKQGNFGFSLNTFNKHGSQFGISLSSPANPKNATEFGLHYQKNIFFNGDMAIDWGVHDIVWYQGGYTNDGLNTNNV